MKPWFSSKALQYARLYLSLGEDKENIPSILHIHLDEPCPDSWEELPEEGRQELARLDAEVYLEAFSSVTEEERAEVYEWVRSGHSLGENPCYICGENGCPMDFLSAMRFEEELTEEMQTCPEHFQAWMDIHADPLDEGGNPDELPY